MQVYLLFLRHSRDSLNSSNWRIPSMIRFSNHVKRSNADFSFSTNSFITKNKNTIVLQTNEGHFNKTDCKIYTDQ